MRRFTAQQVLSVNRGPVLLQGAYQWEGQVVFTVAKLLMGIPIRYLSPLLSLPYLASSDLKTSLVLAIIKKVIVLFLDRASKRVDSSD